VCVKRKVKARACTVCGQRWWGNGVCKAVKAGVVLGENRRAKPGVQPGPRNLGNGDRGVERHEERPPLASMVFRSRRFAQHAHGQRPNRDRGRFRQFYVTCPANAVECHAGFDDTRQRERRRAPCRSTLVYASQYQALAPLSCWHASKGVLPPARRPPDVACPRQCRTAVG